MSCNIPWLYSRWKRKRGMGRRSDVFLFSVSWTTALWTISAIHFPCYELSPLPNLPSHDGLKTSEILSQSKSSPLYLFWPAFCHSNAKVKDATPTLFACDGQHHCFPTHLLKVGWYHRSYQSFLNFESRRQHHYGSMFLIIEMEIIVSSNKI